jgi:hypothetical protein
MFFKALVFAALLLFPVHAAAQEMASLESPALVQETKPPRPTLVTARIELHVNLVACASVDDLNSIALATNPDSQINARDARQSELLANGRCQMFNGRKSFIMHDSASRLMDGYRYIPVYLPKDYTIPPGIIGKIEDIDLSTCEKWFVLFVGN